MIIRHASECKDQMGLNQSQSEFKEAMLFRLYVEHF